MISFTSLLKCEQFYNLFWCLFGLSTLCWNCLAISKISNVDYVIANGNDSIDVFYNGHLDNVSAFTRYNRNLDILQYVIKWKYPVPGHYSLKAAPIPPCESQYTFSEYLNKTITKFYIPPSDTHDFQLHRNCGYDIEVKAYGHVLNIINYIPDSIDYDDINPTYTDAQNIYLYQIYNSTIDKIQYVIKWRDTAPENGYEVNILPNATSDYCRNNGYNHYANENDTVLYIPSSLTPDFELQANCGYIIEVNADGRKLNITSYISDNVQVKQILLKTIYNESMHKIQYVLSWKDTAPDSYSITVVVHPESRHGFCDEKPYESYELNSNVKDHYIPPSVDYDFKLDGNCTYDIEVHYEDTKKNIINTIPACVGPACNCKILSPKPSERPFIEENDGNFNISWFFPEMKENNITDIKFYFFDASCASNTNSTKIKPKVLEENYAIIHVKDVMEGQYCVSMSFINSYGCSYSHSDVREVTFVKSSAGIKWVHVLIAITILVPVLILAYCYVRTFHKSLYKIWRRFAQPRQITRPQIATGSRRRENVNLLYVEKEILDGTKDNYEFPRARITLIRKIGKGAFGEVRLATAAISVTETRYVAIKTLPEKATHEEREDFSSEIDILKKIGCHPNIVTLIGCCTLEEPYMMIMEYVPCGDLKQYLLDLRDQWQRTRIPSSDYSVFTSRSSAYIVPNIPNSPSSPTTPEAKMSTATQYLNLNSIDTPKSDIVFDFQIEKVLDHKELQSFALQIAKGMEHLEKIPITHRDLAARNILVNEHKVLKISDFGLSRKGPYINNKTKKLPLRWTALESIEDHIYDNKSDVWSFAVVLWEIATLGAFPYENIADSMLVYFLQNGKRLSRPEICTDELYGLMLRCWSRDKNLRPSFTELVELLDVTRRRVYVDFSQLNPLYVFPPTSEEPEFFTIPVQKDMPKYLDCP